MNQPHRHRASPARQAAPRHRSEAGGSPTKVKRVHHKRNALSTYMWRNLILATCFTVGLIGSFIVMALMGVRPGTYLEFVKPEEVTPSPPASRVQEARERLVKAHDCSYGALPNNAIPEHAVVVDGEGVPSLVSFEEGLEVYSGPTPENLIAVCAR